MAATRTPKAAGVDALSSQLDDVDLNEDPDASLASIATTSSDGLVSYGAPSDNEDVDELAEGDSALFESSASSEEDGAEEEEELEEEESIGSEDSETDDSRDSDDAYSDAVEDLALDDAGDESYAPDDSDVLSVSGSDSSEDEDGAGEGDDSVDLEWEEACEMAGCAVRAHTRVLKAAAAEGLHVSQPKTVVGVVDVVRALVNTVGAFEEGAVNAEFILAQLAEYEAILLDDDRKFAFADRKDLLNKYLALVKYTPTSANRMLDEVLTDDVIRDDEGLIDLKALVREMKRRSAEKV